MKRTTIFLGDEDRAAIRKVQQRYGVSTDSDAIRLGLRVLAEAQDIALFPLPDRNGQESNKEER
jgi:Arc/MetJ family transcription regulator